MKTKLVHGFLIGFAAAVAALIIWHTSILDRLEYATWSWRVQFFARPSAATGAIKLILLDQQSLDWGKKQNSLTWPWPREVYAPIIDFCTRHGAKAVIFDVLYSEPSVYGMADDRALTDAISRTPIFVGSLCLHRDANFSTVWPPQVADRLFNIASFPSADKIARPSATFPIDEIASSATMLANVIEDPDIDGVFRRENLIRLFNGKAVPSMGFAAFASQCANRPGETTPGSLQMRSGRFETDRLHICGKSIPLDSEGKMILRFRGPSGCFNPIAPPP